jgi:hypothetical protein
MEKKKMVKEKPATLRRENDLATKFIKGCKRWQVPNRAY